jgi:hypothetical protein
MVRHLLAWSDLADNITDAEINVVEDSVITMPNNKRFTVPIGLNTLEWVYYGTTSASSARIFAPSAEKVRNILRIIPTNSPVLPNITVPRISLIHKGYEFDETEDISVRVTYPDVASAERVVTVLSLSGGRDESIPNGEVRIVRCTGSTTLTSNKWSLVTVTPEVQLDAGNYALINFIPYSTNCIAARAIVQGQPYRGGVLGINGSSENNALQHVTEWSMYFTDYNYGVFTHKAIPQFEFLANGADTSEVVYMKVVKIG